MAENYGWVGFDLDGVLAQYEQWQGSTHIGEPIPAMIDLVKEFLANGTTIKIVTARISDDEDGSVAKTIEEWCEKHIGQRLEVTNKKDYGMITLYDDRCVQVLPNTGITLIEKYEILVKKYNALLAERNLKK